VAGKKEMYLRCNHDGCLRIDWKTVHGLQCHIVKNHGIPKGTIGSLELALEKYGVEVQEIEEHEKKHGLGSAGTMAEKGSRGKPRARPSAEMIRPQSSGTPTVHTSAPTSAPNPRPASSTKSKPGVPIVLFPNLSSSSKNPNGGFVQDDIVYSDEDSDGDDTPVEATRPTHKKVRDVARWTADLQTSNSDLSTPPPSKMDRNDDRYESTPLSATVPKSRSEPGEGTKSPPPRPKSSTETLAVTDTAPTSTDNLPPTTAELPLHSVAQTPPIGPETQKIATAVDKVNARLEAENSDFVGSPVVEGDIPSQTQSQTQIQAQETAAATKSNSTSRGRATEKRVRASERWEWAPIDSEDGERSRRKSNGSTLTKAQQELQGIDMEMDGEEGEDGVTTSKSPAISRYSGRKKTRRRIEP
jgi:hypothetical protein